jgi:hypothetical protein
MAGISFSRSSDELMAAAMAATGRVNSSIAGVIGDEREPLKLRSRAAIRAYRFAGNLSKEPLHFLVNNPRSLAHSRKSVFAF